MSNTLRTQSSVRVLIADDESLLAQRFADFLSEKGFQTKIARTGSEATEHFKKWQPDFVFYDLMLPELNGMSFLKKLRAEGFKASESSGVFILSGHNDPANIRECMRYGALDYIAKPVTQADLLSRLILQMRPKREIQEFKARTASDYDSAAYFMHLTDLTLREALKGNPVEECLHNITGMTAVALKAVRVSVVKCHWSSKAGQVIASNDKRSIGGLTIQLSKYPEINYVLNHDKLLALDNLAADPTMHFVTKQTKSIEFNSLVVAPIRIGGQIWGVFSARLPESKQKPLTDFEIRYCQFIAHLVGLVVVRDAALLLSRPDAAGDDPGSNSSSDSGGGALPESA